MVKKNQDIWKCCQNTENTGIWFAQVVNSLILKVKGISIYAAKIPFFFFIEAGYIYQVSLVYVIVRNHVNWHREICSQTGKKQGKHRENTENLKMKFEWVPCTCISLFQVINSKPKIVRYIPNTMYYMHMHIKELEVLAHV